MHKPIRLSKWKKFLKCLGLEHVRTKKHEIWNNKDKPLLRPITFRPSFKEVPAIHTMTSLNTLIASDYSDSEIFTCQEKAKI